VTSHYRPPEKILDELGITEPEEIDLEAIAFYCGAIVVEDDLKGCEARLVGNGERAFITLKRRGYARRRRFSLGHELGHWCFDRGQATFRCGTKEFETWGGESAEARANNYAASLLMPRSMFVPRAIKRPVTLETASDLADTFQTSLTSTAIRLVEFCDQPAVAAYISASGVKQIRRNKLVPIPVKLRDTVSRESVAFDVLRGGDDRGPTDVAASSWFIDHHATWHSVQEHSRRITADLVLTLLWWPDEAHLLHYV
jgi:Zn-dependent peptidase ImmA (M78 family)